MCESALEIAVAQGVRLVTDVREFREFPESPSAAPQKPSELPESGTEPVSETS